MSQLTFNTAQRSQQTLTDITDKLSQTKNKYDDKSLRLHGNSETGKDTLKVHTTKSKWFGLVGGDERDKARTSARSLVRDAIINEFKCTKEGAEAILSKVCKKDDRISLEEIRSLQKQLPNLAMIPTARGQVESLMRYCSSGKPEMEVLVQSLKHLDHTVKTSGMTTKELFGAIDFTQSSSIAKLLEEARGDSLEKVGSAVEKLETLAQTLYNLDATYLGPKELEPYRNLITGTREYAVKFNLRPLISDSIQKRDGMLKDNMALQLKDKGSDVAIQWEKLPPKSPGTETGVEKFKQKTFEDLLTITSKSWSIATSGSSGAMIIKSEELPHNRALLKIEGKNTAQVSELTSDYIQMVSSSIGENKLPVGGMVAKRLPLGENGITDYGKKLEKVTNRDGIHPGAKQRFEGMQKSEYEPVSVMCVENSVDVNRLEVLDKLALCKGNKLAHDLGQAMVLGRLFGCDDHLALNSTDRDFYSGSTNFGNLMINKDHGGLVFIDYAAFKGNRTDSKTNQPLLQPHQITKAFEQILKDVGDFKKGSLEDHLSLISKDFTNGKILAEVLFTAFEDKSNGFASGNLFGETEKWAVSLLTPYDRSRFAANLMLGIVDALQFVFTNKEAFGKGTPMFENPTETLNEITKGIEENATTLVEVAENIREYLKNNPPKFD
ncbi:MAG: hypothetical protein ACO1TE_07240 [Prosthecobacter sp.]